MTTFIDEGNIYIRSGKGGDGMMHFRREKFMPRGGPDGGDGGKGGDVVVVVNTHLNTLFHFRHKNRFIADDGGNGGTSDKTGKSADTLIIEVPPGTVVYDGESGELVVDLTNPDQRFVLAEGGRGGRGNPHFKSARNQAPRMAEKGEPGKERSLKLELRLIADIGLVGVPNAGKSTFLSAVTNATPKIADYPFTTLIPNLGVAELDRETTLVLADIPGLIEGAHRGLGLGHDFLRHVQRTKVLIHLLDGFSEDPVGDFIQINAELSLFDPGLASKPQVVAYNKMDVDFVAEKWPEINELMKKMDIQCVPISAVAGENVRKVLYMAHELLQHVPTQVLLDEKPIYRYEEDPNAFTIEHHADGWYVYGAAIERAAAMTYWQYEASLRRFQRILEALGIDSALRDAGVKVGDTVCIGDLELEWND